MTIRIKIKSNPAIKVRTEIAVPESLSGVDKVDISTVKDGDILMYDDTRKRYAFVDPDVLLAKAITDNQLPNSFIQVLETELDNKVDLDAGSF